MKRLRGCYSFIVIDKEKIMDGVVVIEMGLNEAAEIKLHTFDLEDST